MATEAALFQTAGQGAVRFDPRTEPPRDDVTLSIEVQNSDSIRVQLQRHHGDSELSVWIDLSPDEAKDVAASLKRAAGTARRRSSE